MRNLNLLNKYRVTSGPVISYYGHAGDDTCGAFSIPSPIDGGAVMVIASSDGGWDHVSVSRRNRCPNWPEMAYIKKLFFRDDETAMELHVPASDHISDHDNCLHLWRPQEVEIPRPPSWMVGGCSEDEAEKLYKEHESRRAVGADQR